MTLRRRTFVFLVSFYLLGVFSSFIVWGEETKPDELWFKAVKLANQNQGIIPGKIYTQTQEKNFFGKVKKTEETWSQVVDSEDGKVKPKVVKSLVNGMTVCEQEEKETQDDKNKELINDFDLTVPFGPATNITVRRLEKKVKKDGQVCIVYCFKCKTAKRKPIKGQAWLNESGIPVAMKYKLTSLPKWAPKQIHHVEYEVHYQHQSGGIWYPHKVLVTIKRGLWFFQTVTCVESTYSDYRKPKFLEIVTGSKLLNEQVLPVNIPFEYIDNFIFIKVKLNDNKKNYLFWVDTGTSITNISKRTAAELIQNSVSNALVSDGSNSQKKDIVVLRKMVLGELTVGNCGALVDDFDNLKLPRDIDGIVGSNFLRLFAVRIDYSTHTLTLSRNSLPFTEEIAQSHKMFVIQDFLGQIFVPIRIPEFETPFLSYIDTGSSSSLLIPTNLMEEFKKNTLNCPVVKAKGIFAREMFTNLEGMVTRINEFSLGDLSFRNQLVYFRNSESDWLNLGNKFLSQFTVIIDYPMSMMYLLPLENQKFESNRKSCGFGVERDAKGQVRVNMIWEGSSADQKGLCIGDIILRVLSDGKYYNSYDEIKKIINKNDVTHLFVQRDEGETEIVIKRAFLLPEIE